MFSKSLLTTISLLALVSSTIGAPAKQCPAPSTVTVVAGAGSTSAAATNVAVASSISSAAATASSSSSSSSSSSKGKGGSKGASGSASSSVADAASASSTSKSSSSSSSKGAGGSKGTSGSSSSSVAIASSASSTSAAAAANTAVSSSISGDNFGSCSTPEINFAFGLDGRTEAAFVPTDTKSFNHGSADGIDVITSFICQQLKDSCKANAAALSTCTTASAAADAATKGGAQADAFNAAFGITTNFASTTGSAASSTTAASSAASTDAASGSATTNVAIASSTAATGSSTSGGDDQTATTLNPAVIATGFAQDGQQVPAAGQVASLTSTNNYINFCLTTNKPITNGQQIKTGSCNPAPMGVIAATTNMPSSKFTFPTNFGTVKANTEFTISMAINNLEAGNFVNAADNYYSAPQQVNSGGNIIGHSHVVIEALSSLNQTTTTNPNTFAFFKGINGAAVNGVITADVTDGLPAGAYRLASINAAANHQPVLVAVAQHGSLDDMVYFTVE